MPKRKFKIYQVALKTLVESDIKRSFVKIVGDDLYDAKSNKNL